MYDFMAWLQGSALGHAMRESGVWTYGVVNLFHILSVASLFGAVLILDLRLLGVWPSVSLRSVTETSVPVAATAFTAAVITGTCLLATKATEYTSNPFLYIKFSAIPLALLNVWITHRLPGWKAIGSGQITPRQARRLRVAGGLSLVLWLTAVAAGRLIAYW